LSSPGEEKNSPELPAFKEVGRASFHHGGKKKEVAASKESVPYSAPGEPGGAPRFPVEKKIMQARRR